jgi:undecaprenyl-diphosphatase
LIEGIEFDLTWLSSILFGLVSGLAEVLPVSAHAHRILMSNLLGDGKTHILLPFMLHIGSLAALFYTCNSQILRLTRAQKLASVPKSRRKRPLDTRSLMDIRFLRTALVPIILVFFFYKKLAHFQDNLVAVAIFWILNGVILYIPQYLPGSNRDGSDMSPLDSLLVGLGSAASILPGISGLGASVSLASVRGADKDFSLNMALLLTIPVTIGLIAMDIFAIVEVGLAGVGFVLFLKSILAAASAFFGVQLGIRILRLLVDNIGYSVFAPYCWGIGLFTFIFYLTAA